MAEVGRGWANTWDPIELTLSDSHTHIARLRTNQGGDAIKIANAADRRDEDGELIYGSIRCSTPSRRTK